MKTLKIEKKDIQHLLVTKDFVEITYQEKEPEVEVHINQQEIQYFHEQSGKFGKDSDLSNL